MIIPKNVRVIPNHPYKGIFSCKNMDAIMAVITNMRPPPNGDKKLIFARVIAKIYNNKDNKYKIPERSTILLNNNNLNPSKLNNSCVTPVFIIVSMPYLIRI